MTIYWNPVGDDVDPDTIEVVFVQKDGTQTDIGPADVSNVSGMPDSLGGIAPDAVREVAVRASRESMNLGQGNSPVMSAFAGELMLDMHSLNYERGTPT